MTMASPLEPICTKAGAAFAEVAGIRLPSHFGDVLREYQAAISGAALFDESATAKLEVRGPDAPQFLHNISTNEIKSLPLGGGCETYFCDARGKALFVAAVYHVRLADGNNALWLETAPGQGQALLQHLDRFLIAEAVELADVTHQFAQMHLAGPQAKTVIEAALGTTVPELEEFMHMERTFGATATANIRRRNRLGVPGYDIVCLNARAEGIWRMLTAAGALPAGREAMEILRIEAGTPLPGVDFDQNRFVMEIARAERAVSYAKGCFPGQEPIVMARDRAGRINRSFLGLKGLSDQVPTVGARLFVQGQEVGQITSATRSPRLGAPLALGYVHWKYVQPGTKLQIAEPDGPEAVEVLGYPPIPN